MEDYSDRLNFVFEVIQRSDLKDAARSELRQLLERIRQRQNDPNLYLAVIGEFSSGKSTFINALLRDDLLKTSALVTTATATALRYGSTLGIRAEFKKQPEIIKGKSSSSRSEPFGGSLVISLVVWGIIIWFFKPPAWFAAIFILPLSLFIVAIIFQLFKPTNSRTKAPFLVTSNDLKAAGINMRQFIHKITSENEVAKDVENIMITHPSPFLRNGVVIIDTPGTNATIPEHAAITHRVVEHEADAAIIIVPATMPLTQTFVAFLSGPVSPYLHRCIFVITRMDQVRQREQSRLLENVRVRLADLLGIEFPKVHPCSAQVVIDDLNRDVQVEKDLQIWIDKFAQMESEIIGRLRHERAESIKESIQRLFNRLFDQLDSHLRSQWNQYHSRQAEIQREIIQDLNSFASQQHRECRRRIDDAVSKTGYKIDDCINSHRDRTISRIRDAIFGASDWDDLKWVVESRVETLLRDNQQSLRTDVQRECNKLSQAAEEAGRYFDQKFSEAYRRLQALGGRVETNSVSASSSMELNIYSVVYAAQELNSKNFGNSVKGFFSHLFRGLLNERKQKLWDKIRPKIYTYFDTIKKQAQQAVQTDAQNVTSALNQRIDAYITQYKTVVDTMLNEQQIELQRLTKLQQSIQTDLSEIERLRNSL